MIRLILFSDAHHPLTSLCSYQWYLRYRIIDYRRGNVVAIVPSGSTIQFLLYICDWYYRYSVLPVILLTLLFLYSVTATHLLTEAVLHFVPVSAIDIFSIYWLFPVVYKRADAFLLPTLLYIPYSSMIPQCVIYSIGVISVILIHGIYHSYDTFGDIYTRTFLYSMHSILFYTILLWPNPATPDTLFCPHFTIVYSISPAVDDSTTTRLYHHRHSSLRLISIPAVPVVTAIISCHLASDDYGIYLPHSNAIPVYRYISFIRRRFVRIHFTWWWLLLFYLKWYLTYSLTDSLFYSLHLLVPLLLLLFLLFLYHRWWQ